MRAPIPLILLPILSLAACAGGSRGAPPPVPVAPVVPVAPAPMPRPPLGAAPNLTLPARLADGSYATPNRDLSEPATIWHVRAALNVAVLTCAQDPALAARYNRLLELHRAPLARAHAALAAEYRGRDFDAAMTRVYNYFAQPTPQPAFCPAASALLAEAVVVQPADLPAFARTALARLDAPFVDFYRAYDAYRADLASWRGGMPTTAPRIAYDGGDFLRDDAVYGGERGSMLATR